MPPNCYCIRHFLVIAVGDTNKKAGGSANDDDEEDDDVVEVDGCKSRDVGGNVISVLQVTMG